jgi:hypothetical protein
MVNVNTWWEGMVGERFWLGIARRDGKSEVLAAPCGFGRSAPGWTRPQITHVKDGDVVFHYDEARQAIVARSIARGRARKRRLDWSGRERGQDPEGAPPRMLPSWTIGLEGSTPLDNVVPLDEIARIQWDLFPALREFEDEVGEPIYYPFAMGSPSDTHLLPGFVFKLPALFVERVPALVRASEQVRWSTAARTRAVHSPPANAALGSRSYSIPQLRP